MPLTSICTELAAKGRETSDQANDVLRVFKQTDHCGYPFNTDSNPAIISIGYVGDLAVTAAACYESVMAARPTIDEVSAPFIGLPFLAVYLVATENGYRRRGYSKQLVGSILNLAASHNLDRVEAMQPTDDDAKLFWIACGLEFLPYESFGHYDMYRRTREVALEDIDVEVIVSDEVNQRLADFAQVQVTN